MCCPLVNLNIKYPNGPVFLTDSEMYKVAIQHIGAFNPGMQWRLVQLMINLIDSFHREENLSQAASTAVMELLNKVKTEKPALVTEQLLIEALTTDWTLMFSPKFYTLTMNLAATVPVMEGFVWPQDPGCGELGDLKHHLQYTWDLIVTYRKENLMSVLQQEVLWWLEGTNIMNKSESGMLRAAVVCFPAFDHGFQRTLLSHLLFEVYRAMTNKSFKSPETKEAALKVAEYFRMEDPDYIPSPKEVFDKHTYLEELEPKLHMLLVDLAKCMTPYGMRWPSRNPDRRVLHEHWYQLACEQMQKYLEKEEEPEEPDAKRRKF